MSDKLPAAASNIAKTYPEVWKAYGAFGKAISNAGPLDAKSRRLVNLALAMGGRSEGAVHSHARQALSEGITKEEVKHVALLAMTTLGFPQGVAGLSWIEDITNT
ncbi:MAG: carboxymuconolactone decarboxylase family protein [Parvularculaceae bacterium]